MNSETPTQPEPPALTPEEIAAKAASAAKERFDAAQKANVATANRLFQLAHLGFATARKADEKAKKLEAHARDFEGSIVTAGSVNYTDPARAAALLIAAEKRFAKGAPA